MKFGIPYSSSLGASYSLYLTVCSAGILTTAVLLISYTISATSRSLIKSSVFVSIEHIMCWVLLRLMPFTLLSCAGFYCGWCLLHYYHVLGFIAVEAFYIISHTLNCIVSCVLMTDSRIKYDTLYIFLVYCTMLVTVRSRLNVAIHLYYLRVSEYVHQCVSGRADLETHMAIPYKSECKEVFKHFGASLTYDGWEGFIFIWNLKFSDYYRSCIFLLYTKTLTPMPYISSKTHKKSPLFVSSW